MSLTIAEYSKAKLLDPEKLAGYAVTDSTWNRAPAVQLAYWSSSVSKPEREEGRWRISLNGGDNFRWGKGVSAKRLYGWDRINRDHPEVLMVEGESDCHACWHAGLRNVLGVPGVRNIPDSIALQLDWAEVVYVNDEQDDGSPYLIATLARRLRDKLRIVTVRPDAKDFSELWIKYGGDRQRFVEAVQGIKESWREPTDEERRPKTTEKVPFRYQTTDADGTTGSDQRMPDEHDTGNADRLAELHGESIRYVPVWNEWLAWDGNRWERDTRAVRIGELAKDVGRELIKRAADITNTGDRGKALRWANQSLGANRIHSMIDLTRGIGGIPVDHESLDTNPWLLGVRNGVVDLQSGQFRKANPDDLMMMQSPVEWDDLATGPRWEAALEEWFPDPATRSYVHRLVGQALVGLQQDHLFVIHYGVGGNGKGTFVRALRHVLGPYAAAPDLKLLVHQKWGAHDTATSTLFRARLAVASETEHRVKLNEASIKNLTGGDRIPARRLYENPWEFNPSHTLWLQTNYLPEITGRDPGIWRRIKVVPWVASFTTNKDTTLDQKLQAEAAGILRWAVEGVRLWQEHGLDEPPTVVKATTEYRASEDVLGRFAADVGLVFNPDLTIGKTELSAILDDWVRTEGIKESPKSELSAWLTEHECRDDRDDQIGPDGKRKRPRIWRGVGIRNTPEPPETSTNTRENPESGPDGPGFPELSLGTHSRGDFTSGLVHPVQDPSVVEKTLPAQGENPARCPECGMGDGHHGFACSRYDDETDRIAP